MIGMCAIRIGTWSARVGTGMDKLWEGDLIDWEGRHHGWDEGSRDWDVARFLGDLRRLCFVENQLKAGRASREASVPGEVFINC